MNISELDYDLPPELIAQHPAVRRDGSRLLVYDRSTGDIRHRVFSELEEELRGELVVVNDTRVLPARIPLELPRGEVLLLEQVEDGIWEGLARPTRRLRAGRRYGEVELLEHLGEGRWRLRLHGEPAGETPLPPYITEPLEDPERYQTVYGECRLGGGADCRASTSRPSCSSLDVERVTLHVGLDTFRPVAADELDEHELHGERYEVPPGAWERITCRERVLAVGTTTVRVLETLARGASLGRSNEPLHHARLQVRARRRAAHELPPAAFDAAGAGDGVRRRRGDERPVRARRRRALPLLLLRRRDADPLSHAEGSDRRRDRRGPVLANQRRLDEWGTSPSPRRTARRAPAGCRTAHGDVATPAFMPVGTKGPSKASIPTSCARSARRSCSATRTTCTSARGGSHRRARRPPRVHGLGRPDPHRLGRLPGLLAPPHDRAGRRRGVTFRSVYDGDLAQFSPEIAAAIQRKLGSDIAMCLDQVPPPGVTTRASWRMRCAARRCGRRGSAPRARAAASSSSAIDAGSHRRRAAPPLDRRAHGARLRRLRARRAGDRRGPRPDARDDGVVGAAASR